MFYIHDSETGKQESLGTRDRAEAATLLNARNESVRQPQLASLYSTFRTAVDAESNNRIKSAGVARSPH